MNTSGVLMIYRRELRQHEGIINQWELFGVTMNISGILMIHRRELRQQEGIINQWELLLNDAAVNYCADIL